MEDKPRRLQERLAANELYENTRFFTKERKGALLIFILFLLLSATLDYFLLKYWLSNPDQVHNGTIYDCYTNQGDVSLTGNNGTTYNYGIKANNSFIYPIEF